MVNLRKRNITIWMVLWFNRVLFNFEGKVDVDNVKIIAGDFITFPKELKCVGIYKEDIIKYYNFE